MSRLQPGDHIDRSFQCTQCGRHDSLKRIIVWEDEELCHLCAEPYLASEGVSLSELQDIMRSLPPA